MLMHNLAIRELRIEDEAPFISAMLRSEDLHYPWIESPKTKEAFQAYFERSRRANHRCLLVFNHLDHIIGVFNISEIIMGVFQSAFLGFYVVKDYAGQGYMSQGLKLVLKYVFEEIKLHRIEAGIQPKNTRSISLVKANGLLKEGYSPRYLKIDGELRDHERWALTYEDWEKSR